VDQRLLVVDDVEPLVHAGRIDDNAWVPLDVPAAQATAREGKGLSAITVDPDSHSVWIANREALPADGLPTIGRLGTVVRLSEFTRQTAEEGPQQAMAAWRDVAYRVDPVHEGKRVALGASSSGVTALAGIGDGRLLVLETSRAPVMPPFRNQIFVVDPRDSSGGEGISGHELPAAAQPIGKSLVWEQTGGVCLEGLCVGPTLSGGERVLVAVGDNEPLGTPTTLVILRWNPSGRQAPRLGFGWPLVAGLAALGTGWGVIRLAKRAMRTRSQAVRDQAATARLVLM